MVALPDTAAAPRDELAARYGASMRKLRLTTSLREIVALRPEIDILPSQWECIELPLAVARSRIAAMLQDAGDGYLHRLHSPPARRALNECLGRVDAELARTLGYFDTFVDVLSQRHLPEVGELLRACDVLAFDALQADHPALAGLERPLVHLDRGVGASTLRQGVALSSRQRNPLQTIQIPYTKLREKHGLTSIVHEAGHAAMARLGLNSALPGAIRTELRDAGASRRLQQLFGSWMTELGPDLWEFGHCGMAQALGVRDVLSLGSREVHAVHASDPHPPPCLRVRFAFECCRQRWGRGPWDAWEEEWTTLYPLRRAHPGERAVLEEGLRFLPVAARASLTTRFDELGGRALPALFRLDTLDPRRLKARVELAARSGTLDLSGLAPCGQLALFNVLRARGVFPDPTLDAAMDRWLRRLASP